MRALGLDQDDHFADLSDFLAQLVLQQLAFALHDRLDVADALVHRGKSFATLALQLADVLGVPLDVSVHLGQQLGLDVLHKTADTNVFESWIHKTKISLTRLPLFGTSSLFLSVILLVSAFKSSLKTFLFLGTFSSVPLP